MAHEDCETAIERQLQGALDATEVATLRQHLAGCASCRVHEAAARELNVRMETMFRQTTAAVDLNRIGERAQALLRAQRRSLWIALSALLVPGLMVGSSMIANPVHLGARALSFLSFMTFGGLVMRRAMRVELRKAEWQLATKGGLDFCREALDQQIRL